MTTSLIRPRLNEGADILRGIAILMVVVYHVFGAYNGYSLPWAGMTRDFSATPSPWFLPLFPISLGWAGVSLFFVLSGFCIQYSTLRSSRTDWNRFFWRRFWRIYPAYFAALIVFSRGSKLDLTGYDGAMQFFSHAFLVHNFQNSTLLAINPSFWSIATEVQLYLLFPLFTAIRARIGIRGALIAAFGLACVWRAGAIAAWGWPDHVITPAFASPLMCWFDWILGAYVAECYFEGRRAFSRPSAWLLMLVPAFLASNFYKPAIVTSFTLAAAISAVILDRAIWIDWRQGLARRVVSAPLIFIGLISYSVYLWHQPLIFHLEPHLARRLSPLGVWATYSAFIIFGSWLSYRFLERPGVAIGDFVWKRLRRGTPVVGQESATVLGPAR